jgi:hypothetical protein
VRPSKLASARESSRSGHAGVSFGVRVTSSVRLIKDSRMSADTAATGDTYDAFLSYSRSDTAVAAGLQKALHKIGRRAGRPHALRIFRDKTDLSAALISGAGSPRRSTSPAI